MNKSRKLEIGSHICSAIPDSSESIPRTAVSFVLLMKKDQSSNCLKFCQHGADATQAELLGKNQRQAGNAIDTSHQNPQKSKGTGDSPFTRKDTVKSTVEWLFSIFGKHAGQL